MLSSINIVEHELYFFVSCPGETWGGKEGGREGEKKKRTEIHSRRGIL